MTCTPVAERLEVGLSLHVAVLSNNVARDRDLNMLTNCAAIAAIILMLITDFLANAYACQKCKQPYQMLLDDIYYNDVMQGRLN